MRVVPCSPPLAGLEDDILRALRRISRAIDLHSKHLASTFGLTGPQLVALRSIGQLGDVAPSELAREVSLSQATMTGIIDRLAARQLVTRERSTQDRRRVTVRLTDAGRALIEQAPSPLQERFVERLVRLEVTEQDAIRASLERIVEMMGGDDLDAAPLLEPAADLTDSANVARPIVAPDD